MCNKPSESSSAKLEPCGLQPPVLGVFDTRLAWPWVKLHSRCSERQRDFQSGIFIKRLESLCEIPWAPFICGCACEPSAAGKVLKPLPPPRPNGSFLAAGGIQLWEVAECGRRSPKLGARAPCSLPSAAPSRLGSHPGWACLPMCSLKDVGQNQHFPNR